MADTNTKAITPFDIECAKITLDSACDAIAAITNAVEILSGLDEIPDGLFKNTIPNLMSHATYLAQSLGNDAGCFIEHVESSITETQSA